MRPRARLGRQGGEGSVGDAQAGLMRSVKAATEKFLEQFAITAADASEVNALAVGRPRRVALNEILIRPTAQAR